MSNVTKVLHLRSKDTNPIDSSKPKLPSSTALDYGEIAINYHNGVETLSIKNDTDNVVTFPTQQQVEDLIASAVDDFTAITPNEVNSFFDIKTEMLQSPNFAQKVEFPSEPINRNWEFSYTPSNVENTFKLNNSIEIDLSALEGRFECISPLTTCQNMFNNCNGITSITFNNFNSSDVESMSGMFMFCSNLKQIEFKSFSTSNVQNMDKMFYCCNSMETVNVSTFDTSNVTSMNSMFAFCSSLKGLDLKDLDVSNVDDFKSIFKGSTSLQTINLSNWHIKTDNIDYMFDGCDNLKTIILNNSDNETYLKLSAIKPMGCTIVKN